MSKKLLIVLVILVFLVSGTIWIKKYFFKSWTSYYQEKLYKDPRPLLIKSLTYFNDSSHEKRALDLGAGAGNDTAYLLKHGWKVWANDAEKEATNIIASRHDIEPYRHNLTIVEKSFSEIPWNDLPQFDLVYAGYSLPFINQSKFKEVWSHIVQAIKSNGIFAGHFFGPDDGGFNWWTRRNMTFFTKKDLLNLFEGFQIEFLKEFHEKNEQGVWDHSYKVVLRKQ